ncbi:MAG: UDP-2,3-diacylglucosamine diphosphatase [Planctomycetaceae bacterium]|nr:UDP-2,3-diacylglucosamine diphosphatase [Planctomycetaceae bacterium]
MLANRARKRRHVRSLFVSDIHLGCRHAHVAEFLDFLDQYHPERLYIVGDFIDWWKLRKSHEWQQVFNDILARLYELSEQGVRIYYTPGNHDAFLRQFSWNFSFVKVSDEFVIRLADGRRFLVTHGDKFDRVECAARWVSVVASFGYDALLTVNRWVSWVRGNSVGSTYSFSNSVKRTVKHFVRYISDFEHRLADHARKQGCDGVICGHIHTPTTADIFGIAYCNTGDWVENCTAFVEHDSGVLELIRYFDEHRRPEPSDAEVLSQYFAPSDADLPLIEDLDIPEPVVETAGAR